MSDPEVRLTQMPIDPAERPQFSHSQLSAYFERIQLPQEVQDGLFKGHGSERLNRSAKHALPLLQTLMRHHMCYVPFENLLLHYSANKAVSLEATDLYDKFVTRGLSHGRGGRCMENNTFFGTVLRSLGFRVRNCAGRVSRNMCPYPEVRTNQSQTYDGWNHMLNLVRFDAQWYVVDVGMGGMGPNLAYPLQDGFETESVAPRRIRLQRRSIPENAADDPEDACQLWCYDVCRDPLGAPNEWLWTYCFTELEFLPQDYEMMSWYTSTSPRMFFTRLMMISKMVADENGTKIIGDITMVNDGIRRTIGGKREVVCDFKTEAERLQGLKTYFDVTLDNEEADALSGPLRLA